MEKEYFTATLDGRDAVDLTSFLKSMAQVFNFPEYYGGNMNALSECLNDLSWLPSKNYHLIITNHEMFLGNEVQSKKDDVLNFLFRTRKEWANVPNFPGEEEFRSPADFKITLR